MATDIAAIDLTAFALTATVPSGCSTSFMVRSFKGTEQLGRLFEYTVELSCTGTVADYNTLLGGEMTIAVKLNDTDSRFFNGFVSRFELTRVEGNESFYRATLVPWLWFLSQASNCRIFRDQSVPQIIEAVFQAHSFSDYELHLGGNYRDWEYSAQHRETDFNYISRLMEQEGIYYYFKHEDGKHTLMLADSISAHDKVTGYEKINYYPPTSSGVRDDQHIFKWSVEHRVKPGSFRVMDYDFTNAATPLQNVSSVSRSHASAGYEMFDYPGEYQSSGEGDGYARVRIEELHAGFEVASARANTAGLTCGAKFELDQNGTYLPSDQTREYLVTSISYDFKSSGLTSELSTNGVTDPMQLKPMLCEFTTIEKDTPYRSPRTTPLPEIKGPQTAVVVGSDDTIGNNSGQDVHTDEYGRVRVLFHWDRDGTSSCWVRVSQNWAGKRWGGMFIPYVGQEVMVDFLEGDPDRPVIVGCLYNSGNRPKHKLPDNKRKGGICDAHGNEILFNGVADSNESHYRRHGRYAGNTTGDTVEKSKVEEGKDCGTILFLNTSGHKPSALAHHLDGVLDYTDGNRTEVTLHNREVSIGGKSRISIGAGGLGVWDAGSAWVNNMRQVGQIGSVGLWRHTVVEHTSSDSYQFGDTESFFAGFTFSGMIGLSTSAYVGGNLGLSIAANVNVGLSANVDINYSSNYEFSGGGSWRQTKKEETTASQKITLQVNPTTGVSYKAGKVAAVAAGAAVVTGVAATAAAGVDDSASDDSASTWGSRIGIGLATGIWAGSLMAARASKSKVAPPSSKIELSNNKIVLSAGPAATSNIEITPDGIKLSASPTCSIELKSTGEIITKSGTNKLAIDSMGIVTYASNLQLHSNAAVEITGVGLANLNANKIEIK